MRTSLEMAHETIQARDLTLANQTKQPSTFVAQPAQTDEVAQDFEAAKTLLAERDAKVSELEELIADLEQDLGDHRFAWESVNVAMAERLAAVSELNMELDSLEGQLQDTLAKVDAQNATIADLISEAKASSETLSLQQSSHDNEVANLSAQLQTANAQATMRASEHAAEMTQLEKQLQQARTELNTANARIGTHADGIGELMKQLEAARAELETLRAAQPIPQKTEAANTPAQFVQLPKTRKAKAPKADKADNTSEDNLTDIVGIGAVYAKRLRKEGVRTFKALAKLKPAQLQKIINPNKWQMLDFDSWIEQARTRSK
ncbi:MAG: hypothetical protein HC853_10170 [Anaerolineae bacterium]|nr:hypothetical protein [Anaerolineae bacterium]